MSLKVLLFRLGEENHAIRLDSIESIFPLPKIFPIPTQPNFIDGFLEFEGECIPLVSLYQLLGVPKTQQDLVHARALVLTHQGFRIAVQVDQVIGSRETDYAPSSSSGPVLEADSILVDQKSYLLLHLDHLLLGNLSVSASLS